MERGALQTVIMDGKVLRDETLDRLRQRIVSAGNPDVCLATVLVGDDAPSHTYVASKHKMANSVGIRSVGVDLSTETTQAELEQAVEQLVDDKSVHGILIQMPLPEHLDTDSVLRLVPAEKDVDGLTEASLGRLMRGIDGHVGCTPLGVLRLLQRYNIETSGRHAVVVGRSTLVGLPLAVLLARKGIDCTVTLAHSRTPDLIEVCRNADILISATGMARSITTEHVKTGAAVIDVGISRTEAGIVGDVDFDSVLGIAGAVTPMPGGTGVMTVASLLENTLAAARMQGVSV